jgi:hypothetical protein
VGGCTDDPAVLSGARAALARRALGRWAMGTGTLDHDDALSARPASGGFKFTREQPERGSQARFQVGQEVVGQGPSSQPVTVHPGHWAMGTGPLDTMHSVPGSPTVTVPIGFAALRLPGATVGRRSQAAVYQRRSEEAGPCHGSRGGATAVAVAAAVILPKCCKHCMSLGHHSEAVRIVEIVDLSSWV